MFTMIYKRLFTAMFSLMIVGVLVFLLLNHYPVIFVLVISDKMPAALD